jgi:predicted outer membrane repeat protein
MKQPNRQSRRRQAKKSRFLPGLSMVAGAGLMTGYLPYMRPAAALTSCEQTIELSGTSTVAEIETAIDESVNLTDGVCLNASTATLSFVRSLGAEDNVEILLDNGENLDIDLYNPKTVLDFGEGISFSAQYNSYSYYDSYGNPYYDSYGNPEQRIDNTYRGYESIQVDSLGMHDSTELEIKGLELKWSGGLEVSGFAKVMASNLNLRQNYGEAFKINGIIPGTYAAIRQSTFDSNGDYEFENGGAVYLSGGNGYGLSFNRLLVENSSFTGNYAFNGGAINALADSVEIIDSQFSFNRARNGGAVWVQTDSVESLRTNFSNNAATNHGGAVYTLASSLVQVVDSTLNQNYADGVGGGVYLFANSLSTDMEVRRSSFAFNRASGAAGGAIGAIGLSGAEIDSSSFIQNTQSNSGGGGGAIGLLGNPNVLDSLTLVNSTFIGNQKSGGTTTGGGALFAIYDAARAPSINIVSNTFVDNNSSTVNNRYEGSSIHLHAYTTNTPSETPFQILGNIFMSSSSLLAAGGPGPILVGDSRGYSFHDGQEDGYATPVNAQFNISDNYDMYLPRTSATTNRHDVRFDELEIGSLTAATTGKPSSRTIRSGSIADNFVQKSSLGALAALLPSVDQQGTQRGSSVMDAGAFEFTGGGGGGGGGGSFAGAAGAKSSFLSPFKFDSPKLSLRQKRQIRAEFAANPLTTTVACKPFVTKAQKVADRKAARMAAKAACDYIQKRYPTVFVRVEPLGVVPKTDPKSRRVQISLG